MSKKEKDFIESLIEEIMFHAAAEAARDPLTGKIDPYAAAGLAFGTGNMDTLDDQMRLAVHLGASDAFDPEEDFGDDQLQDYEVDAESED